MNAQYRIVNECLQLLKRSDISQVKKLRVEIQLIQLKRLILKDDRPDRLTCGSCREESFDGLLLAFRNICNGGGGGNTASDLMQLIGGIIGNLSSADGGEELQSMKTPHKRLVPTANCD